MSVIFWKKIFATDARKLTGIILLNFLLCLPGLWVPYFNMDEATNATFARFINQGELDLAYYLGDTYILTHFLYAWVYRFFASNSLVAIHVVHALWKSLTILALYWAGREMVSRPVGIWSSFFYCVFSVSFMSKDFHTPSAESFSLLPAVLSAGFAFRAMNPLAGGLDFRGPPSLWLTARQLLMGRVGCYFLSGIFAALATLFKAPMGVILVALNLLVFLSPRDKLRSFFWLNLGFIVTFFLPVFFVTPLFSGFPLLYSKIRETQVVYIGHFEDMSFLYWGLKFFIRSFIVFLCLLAMVVFAAYNFRDLFSLDEKHKPHWQKIFFLFTWFFLVWISVAIGKRVFYHYFVFTLAPLALLGGMGFVRFCEAGKNQGILFFLRKHIWFFVIFPPVCGFIDGATNTSTQAPNLAPIISYIQKNTDVDDRIYVWGEVPQVYFLSGRLPASTFFWSHTLAGMHPGSPAMEYVRTTGKNLKLGKLLAKDMRPSQYKAMQVNPLQSEYTLNAIGEHELFTLDELLTRIDNPYWQRVFSDFFRHPPELFIDTAPTNIRGFGYFPLQKYELLKRFILDNYHLETVVDRMVVYRINRD